MSPIERLRAAALPFVTRSLRGARGRRFSVLAVVLALITTTLGGWLALGSGALERGIREDLQLEPRRHDREAREFVVIVDDDADYARAQRERASMLEWGTEARSAGPLFDRAAQARTTLHQAVVLGNLQELASPAHRELQARALELIGGTDDPARAAPRGRMRPFDWNDPREVASLQRIVERRGVPDLERYASPLGAR